MKKSPLHVFIAITMAIFSVSLLLLGLHETGQAANIEETQMESGVSFDSEIFANEPITQMFSLNQVGDSAYMFKNFANAKYRKFNLTNHTWSVNTSNNAFTRTRENYASGVMSNTIYVMGGTSPDTPTQRSDVWRYNPVTGVWSCVDTEESTPPPGGRAGGTFTASPTTGKFLAFGGAPAGSSGADALWMYDPVTGWWTTYNMPNPDGPRPGHSAGVIGDKLYLVGGEIPESGSFVQSTNLNGTMFPSVYITGTTIPKPRKNQATVFDSASNSIFIFGGEVITPTPGSREKTAVSSVLTDSWQLNLTSGLCTRLTDLPQPLSSSKAVGWYTSGSNYSAHSSGVFGSGFQILIVGNQITNGLETSYMFNGAAYDQVEVPQIIDFAIYLPIIIRQ